MDICALIKSCEFEDYATCDASCLKARQDVRDMCSADTCHEYGHSWSCPPACGEIDEWQQVYEKKSTCHVFQTVGQMEDEFDFEAMMDAEALHKERVMKLHGLLGEQYPDALLLSAGTCRLCEKCTYPDEPCRFPNRKLVSMEASGLLVSEVCTLAGTSYNHGPLSIAFVSCVLE